ncbi:catalytic, putative [Ricinus communis]|uniref:Catalytic, putative n=2 Tax=Ricinus communis TaxID=3988 RepID=B9SXE7_RICCO|nr:catalytic, putative [Ricinus communis]
MMREVLRRCLWYRVDWRKLLMGSAIMTVIGILVPTFVLPPLNMWYFPSHLAIPSHVSLNASMQLKKTVTEARLEQYHIVPTAPILSVNSKRVASKEAKVKVSRKKNSVARRRRKKNKVNDDAKVVPPVPPRVPVPHQLQRYIWSLSPNDALLYAKKEIESAPVISDDPYLYAPLFLNVSVFKRSYELMELILKVYIYPDGKRPIFHVPHLNGIYASEGWFMKFMEENRQFVTRDPEKAHLFYLPYSARQLQMALYVPNSHNLRPLSIFMRDYANMIATKYPFWNRTHGRDHFLVACHDWGPYTLTMHEELTKNTIKALCNADASEGIFDPTKDVSLPETTIRIPRRPLKNVGGGIRVSQRPILAFFAGNMHGRVRPTLLQYWQNKDEDLKIYGPLPARISRKMNYVQHMKSSRYCICPMGHEVNSPRIVEAIYYECVPVIIADNFVLPFSDVLDWSAFSIVVAEKDIPKLKEILLAIPLRRYLTMLTNLKMLQRHFLWNPRPLRYDLFHMILHSIWFSRLNQIQIPES